MSSDVSSWRRPARGVFQSPDGASVTVEGVDVAGSWCAVFKAAVAGRLLGFTVAERGESQWYADTRMPGHVTSSRPFRGGEVRIHHNDNEALHVWSGPWWELLYGANRPDRSLDDTQAVFAALHLQDSPSGLRVQSWGSPKVNTTGLLVVKTVPGLGELELSPPADAALPRWGGHRVAHGEIWSQSLGEEGHGRSRATALVHAGKTAVARLLPGPDSTTSEQTALESMSRLQVTWA